MEKSLELPIKLTYSGHSPDRPGSGRTSAGLLYALRVSKHYQVQVVYLVRGTPEYYRALLAEIDRVYPIRVPHDGSVVIAQMPPVDRLRTRYAGYDDRLIMFDHSVRETCSWENWLEAKSVADRLRCRVLTPLITPRPLTWWGRIKSWVRLWTKSSA